VSSAPEFRYTLDAEYLRVARTRAIDMLPGWRRVLVRYPLQIVGGVLCLWYVLSWRDQPLKLVLAIGTTIVVLAYEWRKARRKLRDGPLGEPLESAPVRVSLDEQGLEVYVAESRIRCGWSTLSKARAFADGWLLSEHSGAARWLPRAGLSHASPEEVDECLRAWIRDFARVR
jgi:hypothetical protein